MWSKAGLAAIRSLPLPPYSTERRDALVDLYLQLQEEIDELDKTVAECAAERETSPPVDDVPWRRSDHGTGHGEYPRRSCAIRGWKGGGQLRRPDSERVFQWRTAADSGQTHEARQPDAALPVV